MKNNRYLTLGGLFIALHLLFIFMSRLLTGSELILVIFLPLLSTIYSLNFNKKEVAMFVIAAFLLCLIIEPISTFIYVVPALICGVSYGELRKKEIKELSLVYISSLSHAFSLSLAFFAISLLFKEVNFLNIFKVFINKSGNEFYACVYIILLLLGVLESFVVHMISNNELKRLGYKEIESEKEAPKWINISLLITSIVYLVLSVINPIYSIYVFPFLLAFVVPWIVESVSDSKHKWLYFMSAVLLLVNIYILKDANPIFYPALLILIFLPFIGKKLVRVLYTISLKYSNNGKNKIE